MKRILVPTLAVLTTAAVVSVPVLVGGPATSKATTPTALAKRISAVTKSQAKLAAQQRALAKKLANLKGPVGLAGQIGPAGQIGATGAQGVPGPIAGVAATGDLTGTYPAPQIATGAVTSTKLAAAEPWHIVGTVGEPAFQNSWVNTALGVTPLSLRYRKDVAGVVHVAGQIKDGTVSPTIGSGAVFILPVGYRPTGDRLFSAVTTNGLNVITPGWVGAFSSGQVTVGVGNNAYVSVEMTFIP